VPVSRIKSIVSTGFSIFFQIEEFQTVEYISYMAAFKLKEFESMEKLISVTDLHSIWPLNFYNLNPHFQIAIPKYPL
jgi:hypothetical protein